MGLGSGSKCIYKSTSLTQDHLLKILKDRRDRNVGASNNGNIRRPEIDVDANQVAFKWIKTSVSAAATLFQLCKLLSKLGANINVIVDPPTRHHTKRETTRRKGNAERARLKCISLQANWHVRCNWSNALPMNWFKASTKNYKKTYHNARIDSRPTSAAHWKILWMRMFLNSRIYTALSNFLKTMSPKLML